MCVANIFLQCIVNNMLIIVLPLPLSVFTSLSLPKNFPFSLSLITTCTPLISPLLPPPPVPLSWQWNHFVSWYLYLLQDFKKNKEIERGLCEPWQQAGSQLARYLMVARRSFRSCQRSVEVFPASTRSSAEKPGCLHNEASFAIAESVLKILETPS